MEPRKDQFLEMTSSVLIYVPGLRLGRDIVTGKYMHGCFHIFPEIMEDLLVFDQCVGDDICGMKFENCTDKI